MKTPRPARVTNRRPQVAVIGIACLIGLVSLIGWSPAGASTVIDQLGGDINGEAAGDYSGSSTSLSADGTTVAIGTPINDGANGADSGHTRIYRRNGGAWTQLGNDIDGEAAGDYSGHSVSLSADGTIVAISAIYNDGDPNNQLPSLGHVRIYKWNTAMTSWTQLGSDIDGEHPGDRSGESVSLSADGTTVAISAPDNGAFSGHTRIYRWNGSAWTQLGSDIDGEAAGDSSGYSVSLSADGTTVAIGAPYNGAFSGHTRIYRWNGTVWTQLGSDIDGEAAGDRSGSSVSLSAEGTTVAIGAWLNNGANGALSGHTRIYRWDGVNADADGINGWTQLGGDIDGEAAGDRSGYSVSLSADGTAVAIGAPRNNGANLAFSGHTRIYRLPSPIIVPVWRVTLDPNGGTCTDSTARNETWTSVFVGYRYLPNATDCTRPGYTFTGWANTTTPNTPTGLPLLTDPSDGTRRNFIAANADLIAIWTADPEPITDLTVFTNFLCGPCTTIWLIHPPAPADTTIDITIDDTPASCSLQGDAFGLTFCQITSLTPGTHTITLTPRNSTITGTPTNTTITLRT
ncbi:MAG: hypothetical protein RIS41_932 [Actinomycetota bacterium]